MEDLQTPLEITGGMVAILFLVAISLSYRTWRIYTLLLVFGILCSAGFFFWESILVLKTRQQWAEYHRELSSKLAKVEQQTKEIEDGVMKDGKLVKPGIRQIKQRLVDDSLLRGRVWLDCQPTVADAATGEVKVTVTEPNPHQIKKGMGLFIFDGRAAKKGGRYLGEFRVTNVVGGEMAAGEEPDKADAGNKAPGVITLVPAWRFLPGELDRFRTSPGPWILYDKMPVDDHRQMVSAHLDPVTQQPLKDMTTGLDATPATRMAELIVGVPETVLEEYVKDFQPAASADPPQRVSVKVKFLKNYEATPGGPTVRMNSVVWLRRDTVQGPNGTSVPGAEDLAKEGAVKLLTDEPPRYERELRDYVYLFRSSYLNRQQWADLTADILRQIVANEAVLAQNKVITTSVLAEQGRLKQDEAHYNFELKAIKAHYDALVQQYATRVSEMRRLYLENLELAARLSQYQHRAAAAIERRAPAPQAAAPAVGQPSASAGL